MKSWLWKASLGLCCYGRHSGRTPNMKWPSTSQCLSPLPTQFPRAWNSGVGSSKAARADFRAQSRRPPWAVPRARAGSPQPRASPCSHLHTSPFHSYAIPPQAHNHAHWWKQCHRDIQGTDWTQTHHRLGKQMEPNNNQVWTTASAAWQVRRATTRGHVTEQTSAK